MCPRKFALFSVAHKKVLAPPEEDSTLLKDAPLNLNPKAKGEKVAQLEHNTPAFRVTIQAEAVSGDRDGIDLESIFCESGDREKAKQYSAPTSRRPGGWCSLRRGAARA